MISAIPLETLRVHIPSAGNHSDSVNPLRDISRPKSRFQFTLPQSHFLVMGQALRQPPLHTEFCHSRSLSSRNAEGSTKGQCSPSASKFSPGHLDPTRVQCCESPGTGTTSSTSFSEPATPRGTPPTDNEFIALASPSSSPYFPISLNDVLEAQLSPSHYTSPGLSSRSKALTDPPLPSDDIVPITTKPKSTNHIGIRSSLSLSSLSFLGLNSISRSFRPTNHLRKVSNDVSKVARNASLSTPPARNKLKRRPPPIITQIPNDISRLEIITSQSSSFTPLVYPGGAIPESVSNGVQILTADVARSDMTASSTSPKTIRMGDTKQNPLAGNSARTLLPESPCSSDTQRTQKRRMGLDIRTETEGRMTSPTCPSVTPTRACALSSPCSGSYVQVPELSTLTLSGSNSRRGSLSGRAISLRVPTASSSAEASPFVVSSSVWTEVSPTEMTIAPSTSTDLAISGRLYKGDEESSLAVPTTSSNVFDAESNLTRIKSEGLLRQQEQPSSNPKDLGSTPSSSDDLHHHPLPPWSGIESQDEDRPESPCHNMRRRSSTLHNGSQSVSLLRPDTPFADIFGVYSSARAEEEGYDDDDDSEEVEGVRIRARGDGGGGDTDGIEEPFCLTGRLSSRNGGQRTMTRWLKSPQSLQDLASSSSILTKSTSTAGRGVVGKMKQFVTRKEKKQGWCGEWNQGDMQEVIRKLRKLK